MGRGSKDIFALGFVALLAIILSAAPAGGGNDDTGGSMENYCVVPPFIGMSAPPLVMLVLQRDEKLIRKAYDDISDLDGDGEAEITYKHSIDYYGYFDSYKCYSYSTADQRFDPVSITNDKYCWGDSWSGNFLNWATMTRMDVMRKVFYGGKRFYDSAGTDPVTVLERAFIPMDGHSFAKTYWCDDPADCDLGGLTPFSPNNVDVKKRTDVVSICNTSMRLTGDFWTSTLPNGSYNNATAIPLMRIAKGEEKDDDGNIIPPRGWDGWATRQKYQCVYDEEFAYNATYTPDKTNLSMDPVVGATRHNGYVVRVAACQSGLLGKERCKLYDQHNKYKPIGLLQEYGEDTSMYFGLITGSFTKNKSGGMLRRRLADVGDVNSGEINRDNGMYTGSGNIIPTIDSLGIVNYPYNSGEYNAVDGKSSPTNSDGRGYCYWGLRWFAEGNCTNWGNPLAEMYYEGLRVFAGKRGSTADYAAGTENTPNLPSETWNNTNNNDPYTYSAECAEAFILTISDPYPSYDIDGLPYDNWWPALSDSANWLNMNTYGIMTSITANEGISGDYFIGNTKADPASNLCTAKPVTNLGDVHGICPNEPGTQGGYYLASVANFGQTTDLRPDADPDPDIARTGNQNVTAYSVALGGGTREIKVEVSGSTVTIVPACYNLFTLNSCRLVDIRVSNITDSTGGFYLYWDDSLQGGDFDQDAWQYLYYSVSGGGLQVYSKVYDESTNLGMDIGYIISGTTDDGPHLDIKVNDEGAPARGGIDFCYTPTGSTSGAISSNALVNACITNRFYSPGMSTARFLPDPLWLAAKYGGFTDLDGDGMPNLQSEWDADGNGVPDTYFLATNPLEMEAKLVEAFSSILNRVTSGTAASVLASGEGSGANLVQAVYYPKRRFFLSEVKWIGGLHNYWYYVDPFFNNSSIREDTEPQDRILDLDDDLIVHMFFDQEDMKTKSALYPDSDADGAADPDSTPTIKEFGQVDAIWKAGYYLWARDLTADPRTIYYYDPDNATPLQNFSVANRNRLAELMNIEDRSIPADDNLLETEDIIRYTHGEHVVADRDGNDALDYRGRVAGIDLNGDGDVYDTVTIDIDSDGDTESVNESGTWKLGDIVDSTPRIASSVRLNYYYDRYLDETYRDFYETASYQQRGMVYAGANDGMLHAFKLGVIEHLQSYDQIARINGTDLGREQWAFIPYNALPYLQYIADPDYCHVNTVDLSPLLFDASTEVDSFIDGGQPALCGTDSANCIKTGNSWRTILIGGMRFGGSCRPYGNNDSNAVSAPGQAPDGSDLGYSSYFALDVTDENNPEFLWEFTDPALGFSTSGAAIVRINGIEASGLTNSPSQKTNGHWFAVFASGPTGPINTTEHQFMGRSDQNFKLFIVDLKTGTLVRTIDTGITEAFSSSILSTTLDTDTDYTDNALYIGYTRKDPDVNPKPTWTKGGVGRLLTKQSADPDDWVWSVMVDGTGAVSAASAKTYNLVTGHQWVFTATGRYFYKLAGELDDASTVQGLYGFLDPCYDWAGEEYRDACKNADPADDSTVAVDLAGLLDVTADPDANVNTVLSSGGWKIDLDPATLDTGYGAERVVTDIVVSDEGYVYFTTFQPYSGACVLGGRSYIWVVKYNTGGAPTNIRGRALVQVSTGAIEEINLSDALTEKDGRRTVSMEGVPPTAQGLALLSSPPPVKRVLHIRER